MKKRKYIRVFIVAAMVAFFTVCGGLMFCGNSYTAYADKKSIEASQNGVNEPVTGDLGMLDEIPEISKNEGILPETEGSKWFSETLIPLIMQYGAAALGVLSAGIVLFGKIWKSLRELRTAKDTLSDSNKQNVDSKKKMAEFEKTMLEKQNAYEMQVQEKLREIQSCVQKDVHDTKKAVDKLLAVERRAYLDSPALVASGTAKKIAEVLDETVEIENKG